MANHMISLITSSTTDKQWQENERSCVYVWDIVHFFYWGQGYGRGV